MKKVRKEETKTAVPTEIMHLHQLLEQTAQKTDQILQHNMQLTQSIIENAKTVLHQNLPQEPQTPSPTPPVKEEQGMVLQQATDDLTHDVDLESSGLLKQLKTTYQTQGHKSLTMIEKANGVFQRRAKAVQQASEAKFMQMTRDLTKRLERAQDTLEPKQDEQK